MMIQLLKFMPKTDGQMHNTITSIARYRNNRYELDLVFRNNSTSKEHPMGIFHPHEEVHHIKKENIGLIEVMGLAVLPARLKTEMQAMKDYLLDGTCSDLLDSHLEWLRNCSTIHDLDKRKRGRTAAGRSRQGLCGRT